jgi:hypothetical protein
LSITLSMFMSDFSILLMWKLNQVFKMLNYPCIPRINLRYYDVALLHMLDFIKFCSVLLHLYLQIILIYDFSFL